MTPASELLPSGMTFIQHLIKTGAIPDGKYRRVVIDASCESVVHVYTEQIGSPELLKVVLPDAAIVVSLQGLGPAAEAKTGCHQPIPASLIPLLHFPNTPTDLLGFVPSGAT